MMGTSWMMMSCSSSLTMRRTSATGLSLAGGLGAFGVSWNGVMILEKIFKRIQILWIFEETTFSDHVAQYPNIDSLGGGFNYFLFSSLFGEDSHFDSYFSTGLKPPPSSIFQRNQIHAFLQSLECIFRMILQAGIIQPARVEVTCFLETQPAG